MFHANMKVFFSGNYKDIKVSTEQNWKLEVPGDRAFFPFENRPFTIFGQL